MLWAAVKLSDVRLFFSSSRGFGCGWIHDPGLVFYPSSRAGAAPRDCAVSIPNTCAAVPSLWRSAVRHDPSRPVRAARVSRVRHEPYATFMIAPVGTMPCVTYRQSAITSLRATATMPTRRARFPLPKFI